MSQPIAIFFDIGNTLGVAEQSPTGGLQRLEVFPFVPEILAMLSTAGGAAGAHPRLGLVSNTGSETAQGMRSILAAAGLLSLFQPGLLLFSSVEGIDKTNQAFFRLAADRAGLAPDHCVYVGEDAVERAVAEAAGLRVSYHPLHVFHVVRGMT